MPTKFYEGEQGQTSGHALWCGRMFPEHSPATKEKILEPSLKKQSVSQHRKPPPIPLPARGKWPLADAYYGDGWSVAYRVFDAQFWGVPQRRRRIALVADFGGHAAPEVLFERESVSGNTQTGRTTREKATPGIGGSPCKAISFQERAGCPGGGKGILIQKEKTGALSTVNNQMVFPINTMVATKTAEETRTMLGIGSCDDPQYTISSTHSHAICVCFDARGNGDGKTVCTLTGDHQNRVTDYTALVLNNQGGSVMDISYEKTATLRAQSHGHEPVIAVRQRGFGDYVSDGTTSPIKSRDYKDATDLVISDNQPASVVRRLTPLECERLQGFPDGWTNIGDWIDSAGKQHKLSDSARYKALGNSIAIPPWVFVLSRLSLYCMKEPTMASLFDGIGGFPYIWESLNGKGTCLWASEIEEFPIAVTKQHFGEENQ